jgi:hypothetical protein
MAATDVIARNLAAAFLDGPWSPGGLRGRGRQALGRRERWLAPLVRRVLTAFPELPPREPAETLARWLAGDRHFLAACRGQFHRGQVPLRRLFWATPRMAPSAWPVPALATTAALAGWLGLTPGQLDWFADCQGREARHPPGPLRHYDYRWLAGRSGKRRLLEQPRARLKALQRRVLRGILDLVPPHDAAHGYRKGRGVVSYAAAHARREIVLRLDLRDFFASVQRARVRALFRGAGYPAEVARSLAGLCTNVVPADVWDEGGLGQGAAWERFRRPHLPQGAPTSPAVANLCAYRLDRRLAGLAARLGATYTRYADDLAFSGGPGLRRSARRFQVAVCRVALEEGFEVNTRKTRFMRHSGRQQLAGVVVNEGANCRRDLYDRLKATLTNCVRHGPAGQNRDGGADFRARLAGQVAQLGQLNPRRGARLRALLEQIDWAR